MTSARQDILEKSSNAPREAFAGRVILRSGFAVMFCSLLALTTGQGVSALANPLPGARITSCVLVEGPSGYGAQDGDEEDDDDEDDEEDEDEDDDDDDEKRGFLSADGVTCVAVGGSVTASMQATRQSPKPPGSQGTWSWTASMGLTLGTSRTTDYGVLATSLDISLDTTGQYNLNTATMSLGPMWIGYDSSQFNYWTGDDFAGATLQQMPSTFQLGRKFAFWGDTELTLSFESAVSQSKSTDDTQSSQSAADSSTGSSASTDQPPAGVVIAIEKTGAVTSGKLAVYARPSWTSSEGSARPAAWAANVGLEYDAEAFVPDLTITAQATIASNVPEFIGTRFERASIRKLNLSSFETMGWSGVVSVAKSLTDQLSANAYVSYFKFSLPQQPLIGGSVVSWKGAANLTWSPVDDFNIILEANVSRLTANLSGPAASRATSGNNVTTSLTFTREF